MFIEHKKALIIALTVVLLLVSVGAIHAEDLASDEQSLSKTTEPTSIKTLAKDFSSKNIPTTTKKQANTTKDKVLTKNNKNKEPVKAEGTISVNNYNELHNYLTNTQESNLRIN